MVNCSLAIERHLESVATDRTPIDPDLGSVSFVAPCFPSSLPPPPHLTGMSSLIYLLCATEAREISAVYWGRGYSCLSCSFIGILLIPLRNLFPGPQVACVATRWARPEAFPEQTQTFSHPPLLLYTLEGCLPNAGNTPGAV